MPDAGKTMNPVRDRALRAWMRLARLYGVTMDGVTRQLRDYGLSPAEFDVLAQIGAAEGSMQQEIAERLLVTQGNISYHMARLTQRGLATRRSEGRCKRLFLTPAGRALLHEALPAVAAFHARQFAVLTREEQQILVALLRKLGRQPRAAADSSKVN